MLRSLTRWSVVLVAAAVAGCDQGSDRSPSRPRSSEVVSVGKPVAPRRVNVFEGLSGAVELRALSPGPRGRPPWFAMFLLPPAGRPRDVCVATGLADSGLAKAGLGEINPICDVSVRNAATSFITAHGVPDRYGKPPTVISGVAPPEVRAVRLEGPGGSRKLPLSAHRTFLAIYAASARGRVRLISELRRGETVRTFDLPRSSRFTSAGHRSRRQGAVYNDEIGESITELSYRQLARRYGPPAVLRRERGELCAYYEVVGSPDDGWQFCFKRSGRMASAGGNSPPPAH